MKLQMLAVTFALLLTFSTFYCGVLVQTVQSQFLGSIYIASDGSVMGTDSIRRNGDVYTLKANIAGGIQVQKSGITIDGAGYTIQGSGEGRGLDLSSGAEDDPSDQIISNVTVKNTRIVNFYNGILADGQNNTFYGNYIADCTAEGIWILGGSDNAIMGNTIENNVNGVSICFSEGSNVITKNNMINNVVKSNNVIIVWLSTHPSINGNYWSDYSGVDADGDGVGDTPFVRMEGNETVYVDYHPLVEPVPMTPPGNAIYIRPDGSVEGTDKIRREGNVYTFSGDIHGSIIVEKDDVEIDGSGFVLYGIENEDGTTIVYASAIILENRNNVTLRNIEAANATFGITIRHGTNIEITGSQCRIQMENSFNNVIHDNEQISMLFTNSSRNTVTGNNITNNKLYGFKLQSASNENNIFANRFAESISGIEFHGDSNNNVVYENWITNNADGIVFFNSFNNSIHDNVIAYNSNIGIYLSSSEGNKFFRNDVVENQRQASCRYSGSNIWDNGQEGNYWSNYNGTDSDGNGIGDEPYLIPCFSITEGEIYETDNYPLMAPFEASPIPEPQPGEPFLIPLIIVFVIAVAFVGVGLLVYFKRRKR